MKKLYSFSLLVAVILFCCGLDAFSSNQTIVVNQSKQTNLDLVSSTSDKLVFTSTVGWINLSNVKTDNGNFIRLNISNYGKSTKISFPELPVMHKLI